MKKYFLLLPLFALVLSCNTKTKKESIKQGNSTNKKITQVTSFIGQQVTGVTVTDKERIFVNFPRWRQGVDNSVVEVLSSNQHVAYPNAKWNSWEVGQPILEKQFIGVQSVVAFENLLYILDTRNPLFQGVIDAPRVFVFDLNKDKLHRTYILEESSFFTDSYINDLRIDKKNNKAYFTDSGRPGLVILDLKSGATQRVLNNHISTRAEQSYLTFGTEKWNNAVHSDGIALDTNNHKLYYHALTGYNLYSISTNLLLNGDQEQIEKGVKLETKTAAPDGMIFDKMGNLYFADLENNKIQYLKPDGIIVTLAEGDEIKWADTFSIFGDYLYFTNSRINETGNDISRMAFTLNKIQLPNM